MILVTGGTGFLGSHLVEKLLQSGEKVRCIYRANRPGSLSPHLASQVEWVKGDLLDLISLEKALEGIQQVYHCAGKISFDPKDRKRLFQVNFEGTANLVNTSLHYPVQKFLYVSSVSALGRAKADQLITETTKWESKPNNTDYAISKHWAEMEVWRGYAEGLPTLIINPSLFIGPAKNWEEGAPQLIKSIASGFSFYPGGINGFTDVRDVADLAIQLMNSSLSGEQFIINTDNWSFERLFKTIKEKLNTSQKFRRVNPITGEVMWRLDWLKTLLTNRRRVITKTTVRSAQKEVRFDNRKLLQEFRNFHFIPLEKSIDDACKAYLMDN